MVTLARLHLSICVAWCLLAGAVGHAQQATGDPIEGATTGVDDQTFGEDVDFLNRFAKSIVLRGEGGQAMVVLVPAYQGRVMTSTAGGDDGTSYGWINYKQVQEGGDPRAQINVFGGEERFWLGPEGGQYSLFFMPGVDFEFANWQTPAVIDSEPFDVVEVSGTRAKFRKDATLTNYSKTPLELRVDRDVELLSSDVARQSLGVDLQGVPFVGYRTTNRVTNVGEVDWTHDGGLISVWLLGMFKPGPHTTVVVPFRTGSSDSLGPIVSDEYFGKVPASRLQAGDGVLYFSGDGTHRSKIGVSPQRSKGICGSYDAQRNVLTIVKYNQPDASVVDYVNSLWQLQEEPYRGDAINAYNDGPTEPDGAMLGPFYELETSSPALALKAGESGVHVQDTYHFEGDADQLDQLARQLLGVSLEQIQNAL